jgi:hypothetical protein
MALVTCPCPCRPRRLAQSVGRGLIMVLGRGISPEDCRVVKWFLWDDFSHRMALVEILLNFSLKRPLPLPDPDMLSDAFAWSWTVDAIVVLTLVIRALGTASHGRLGSIAWTVCCSCHAVLRHRTLTWCTRGGSPACGLNAWPRSRGWAFDAEWKWTHADTGHTLNLNDDGHHGEDGYWQHMVSFVPFVARLPGAWFRPCFGWLAPGGCFPFFGLGWLWFLRLSSGLRLPCCVAVVCCGGSLLLPSAHVLSTWGQFMDKVMNNCWGYWSFFVTQLLPLDQPTGAVILFEGVVGHWQTRFWLRNTCIDNFVSFHVVCLRTNHPECFCKTSVCNMNNPQFTFSIANMDFSDNMFVQNSMFHH